MNGLGARVGDALDATVRGLDELDGGEVGHVARVRLVDRPDVVAKTGPTPLTVEADMLRYLADESSLPVPEVYHATDDLLVLAFVRGDGRLDADVARDAADHLAALHATTADACGFPFDTLSGPYDQPNPWTDSWVDFYRDERLLPVARAAHDEGSLPTRVLDRVRRVGDAVDSLLVEPDAPALVHGDVWRANLVVDDGRVAAFLDPACYYGHPEVELAYVRAFDGFGEHTDAFFDRYDEVAGVDTGFFAARAGVYALYPLLEHVRYFGDDYLPRLTATLSDLGY